MSKKLNCAKFRTFLISRNFANNFHFYFVKFRERWSRNFAKFREINWKFREIRKEFLVRNFAKFRIAKFRIHPRFRAKRQATGIIGRWLVFYFRHSKGNRRNAPMLVLWNSCTSCLPITARATPAVTGKAANWNYKTASVNTSCIPKKRWIGKQFKLVAS
jgi:hypothetical protein